MEVPVPNRCNVNSWEVEIVLERPTLLNAQDTFLLHVHYSRYHVSMPKALLE